METEVYGNNCLPHLLVSDELKTHYSATEISGYVPSIFI